MGESSFTVDEGQVKDGLRGQGVSSGRSPWALTGPGVAGRGPGMEDGGRGDFLGKGVIEPDSGSIGRYGHSAGDGRGRGCLEGVNDEIGVEDGDEDQDGPHEPVVGATMEVEARGREGLVVDGRGEDRVEGDLRSSGNLAFGVSFGLGSRRGPSDRGSLDPSVGPYRGTR